MICSALDLITLWNHFILEKEKEKEKAKHTHALIPEILCDCLQKYVKQHEQLQKSGTHSIVCMSPKSENGTVVLRFVRTCNDKVVKPLSATRQSTRIFVCVLIIFYDLFCGCFSKNAKHLRHVGKYFFRFRVWRGGAVCTMLRLR